MSRSILASLSVAASLLIQGAAVAQQPPTGSRWISAYDAQRLVGAPITQPAVLRNFGPVDLGGGGTRVGNGDEPAVDTTLYSFNYNRNYSYYNPSFIGYNNTAYASYGGMGYGGHPLGIGPTNYPTWAYRPRYFYPYRYYPLRTGFSIYNPYFSYGNTYYGGYANPFWSGFGGFGFPYHFGAFGTGGAGYTFGAFGQPYRYGIFGYPYPRLSSLPYAYMPSQAYFMYPGLGGLYVPPGFVGQPGYRGYEGYGLPVTPPAYSGGFYW